MSTRLPKYLSLASTALVAAGLLSGCTQGLPEGNFILPNSNTGFDYQLGGAYTPPNGVTIVARDRTEPPAGLGYDICYVNGYQTQPEASESFAASHPELLVHYNGVPLRDPGWPDEILFDTSTAQNRAALADFVGQSITSCKTAGFDAVEIDNLDSYTRAHGLLTEQHNIDLAIEYARIAHDAGLAIAQKNTPELSQRFHAAGYDFVVAESCYRFSECELYANVYPVVLDIEYTDGLGEAQFSDACKGRPRSVAMVLRDHGLAPSTSPDYHFLSCTGR